MTLSNYKDNFDAIKVIIALFAYFTVFENRFTDHFFMCIQRNLFSYYLTNATNIIKMKFTPNGSNESNHWISESIQIKQQREKIKHMLEVLRQSLKLIQNI